MNYQEAYFAGGCFWCITPVFRIIRGVISVTSGYSGGKEQNPTYEDVKSQRTGHREAVCVVFDGDTVTFEELLDIFLSSVDIYDGEGQFIDRGRSYTLAVYYTNLSQKEISENAVRHLSSEADRDVQISVEPFSTFYPAEEYHQDFDLKNPERFKRELEESGRNK